MKRQRLIVQMGIGVAFDATEAATKAVAEATGRGTVHLTTPVSEVVVRLGAPDPAKVDSARVAELFADGAVDVRIVPGGQVFDGRVLVCAAVERFYRTSA